MTIVCLLADYSRCFDTNQGRIWLCAKRTSQNDILHGKQQYLQHAQCTIKASCLKHWLTENNKAFKTYKEMTILSDFWVIIIVVICTLKANRYIIEGKGFGGSFITFSWFPSFYKSMGKLPNLQQPCDIIMTSSFFLIIATIDYTWCILME